jgi:hypothetical protein
MLAAKLTVTAALVNEKSVQIINAALIALN